MEAVPFLSDGAFLYSPIRPSKMNWRPARDIDSFSIFHSFGWRADIRIFLSLSLFSYFFREEEEKTSQYYSVQKRNGEDIYCCLIFFFSVQSFHRLDIHRLKYANALPRLERLHTILYWLELCSVFYIYKDQRERKRKKKAQQVSQFEMGWHRLAIYEMMRDHQLLLSKILYSLTVNKSNRR